MDWDERKAAAEKNDIETDDHMNVRLAMKGSTCPVPQLWPVSFCANGIQPSPRQ